ncbi:hypothetical protein B0A55_03807 [Friedmanniomyces simplex]|uniref:Uncharacterized protein n=1 Tax=Friedmanniomyces simplex TaxID=329884 RepID=A0A4U0XT53_9PEZI|nr:hypothetical protein B0A55_03807 [Friedmanniomyces simplex]
MHHSSQSMGEPPAYQSWSDNNKSAPSTETSWDDNSYSNQHYPTDEKLSKISTLDTISNSNPPGAPVKTYHIINHSTWTERLLEIQHQADEQRPILWVRHKRGLWKPPQIHLHADTVYGEIVAACKLSCWKRHLRYILGNPDSTDKDAWPTATHSGGWRTSGSYSFALGGETYEWKRTHRKELGASRFGQKDFKLVDGGGRILAVFLFTQRFFAKSREVGRLEWYAEVGREAELASLVILLGIKKAIQQSKQAAAAGAA